MNIGTGAARQQDSKQLTESLQRSERTLRARFRLSRFG